MERKSMGGFIAALRKANGMTQKTLAERLNVSDKAVSRWERDECAPDLSLIPIIAEIFNVTADELLSGERKAQISEDDGESRQSQRSEKQVKRLLNSAMRRLKNLSFIPIGLASAAIVAGALFEYFIENHYLTFCVIALLIIAAAVCEAAFLGNAFSSIDSESVDAEKISEFKVSAINFSKNVFALCFYVMYAFVALLFYLPFCTGCLSNGFFPQFSRLSPNRIDHSIFSPDVILITVLFAAFAYVLFKTVWLFVLSLLKKRGAYPMSEQKHALNRFSKKFFAVFTLIVALTTAASLLVYDNGLFINQHHFSDGRVFNNYDSFKIYAETEVPTPKNNITVAGLTYGVDSDNLATWLLDIGDGVYKESGEDDEDLNTYEITDNEGWFVCSGTLRNKEIAEIHSGDNNGLPIKVYTFEDLAKEECIYRKICVAVISAELLIMTALYIVLYKRKRKALELR